MAPNLHMWLWRPIIAEPPMYSQKDLREWVTFSDVFDANEALDLKAVIQQKAAAANKSANAANKA